MTRARLDGWVRLAPVVFVFVLSLLGRQAGAQDRPPNIVYIMSDELAYYELGHMGNTHIRTPRIDRMAREGLRFTRAYAGSCVCAPLRCNLMTGLHAGHASVRANDGGTPLREGEATIASLLKERGYATGGFGKWGCGGRDSTGVPESHGFDQFFGYYDQVHAHSYYPPYLIRNSEEVSLEGNVGGSDGQTYSHYAIMDEAIDFIRSHRDQPFFCYLPITPPHGMYSIPADDPAWDLYAEDEWMRDPTVSQEVKNYAAMVSMVDRNVGEVLDLLDELGLAENTIVFFTGDNGGQDRFRDPEHPRGFFGPNVHPATGVEFRGGKGNLYEGGLRIPFLVRWPGHVDAGRVSDFVFYQPDILPTLTELAGARTPENVDGTSILAEIFSATDRAASHEFMYWEFGQQVAVRHGRWKAIRPRVNAAWELYDLEQDVSESHDVAGEHEELLAKLVEFAKASHEDPRPGEYLDAARTRHEQDRAAKWGSSRNAAVDRGQQVQEIVGENLIPADKLKLVEFSSESDGNRRLAAFAVDGDPRTHWHSRFGDNIAEPPHTLVIDLGQAYDVTGFAYLARQDNSWNGCFGETQFLLSDSPDGFDDVALQTSFRRVKAPQRVSLETPMRARYVLVRVNSEANNGPWASAAEIGIFGTPVVD